MQFHPTGEGKYELDALCDTGAFQQDLSLKGLKLTESSRAGNPIVAD